MSDLKNVYKNNRDENNFNKPEKVKLPCKNCGATNNVEVSKINKEPICGNCKKALEIFDTPVNVTTASFDKEVIQWPGIVLVDFWATWCPPCKMIAPVLEAIAKEEKGSIKIVKVNVDKEPDLSGKNQINSIPTLIIYNSGKQINRTSGAMPKNKLLNWIYSSV